MTDRGLSACREPWMPRKSPLAALLSTALLLAGAPLRAQMAVPEAAPIQPADTGTASFAFDVATFKPSDPKGHGFSAGFTPTGLRVTNFPLSAVVQMAYSPMNNHRDPFVDMPAWAYKDFVDVDARVDEASASAWLSLNSKQRAKTGQLMLQKLLAERCKLVTHTVPVQVDGYALVVGKGGSRLTPTKPGETYPQDAKNGPDGSKVVWIPSTNNSTIESYFNTDLEFLTNRLGLSLSWDVQDRTTLTGRYDFTVRRLDPRDANGKRINDPLPSDLWDLSGTGLEIKPAKIQSENLVVDHIERPTPN